MEHTRPFLPDARHIPGSAEFGVICRLMLQRNDDFVTLATLAEQRQLPGRIQRALKAAVPGAGFTGGANDAWRDISSAFADTLAEISVFDRLMAGGAMRLPLNARIIAAATLPQGYNVPEGKAKPLTSLSMTASDTELRKAAATLIVSDELARNSEPGAAQMIIRSLRNAIAFATDAMLLNTTDGLLADVVPVASVGDPLADIDELLASIDLGEASRPYFLVEPAAAKKLATKNVGGQRMFTDMSPMGGQMVGVETLVSSALPDGYFVALDAAWVGLADNGIEPSRATHADVEMDNAPVGDGLAPVAASGMTSLWQQNLVGLRCERDVAWRTLRARAISAISGVAY